MKITTFITILISLLSLFGCSSDSDYISQKRADEIIRFINEYKKSHHSLPDSIEDFGFKDSNIFYRKDGEGYIIWYGKSLGTSRVYRSTIGAWRDEG